LICLTLLLQPTATAAAEEPVMAYAKHKTAQIAIEIEIIV
jgi:hypothetical protein